ncbi:hypothetical protein FH972_014411 [Carpinus fangiana]|uniref:Uncharacterized protein n=1 Tax=Carpinus fangiana TaxID=176857 RepID=A0A5N6RCD6_9ROSI|nr:hypothetical protein FH972_014411 [Carpinus fangiana]
MARDFGALVGAHVDDAGIALGSSGGLLLLGMIIMSLSIISMLIFACGDDNSGTPRNRQRFGGGHGHAGDNSGDGSSSGTCGDDDGGCDVVAIKIIH